MKNLPYSRFTLVYALLGMVVIAADMLSLQWTYYLSKPIMLIAVFSFFKMHSKPGVFRNLLLTGFFFSLLGDIALMFQKNNEAFFMVGLGTFLIAHICYSSAFVRDMFDKRPWNQHWGQLALSTLMIVYGAEFFIINRSDFGQLFVPVLIYCMAISAMGVSAIMRNKYKNEKGYLKVVFGAVFFVVSDSLLATNIFITPLPYSGLLILSTYFIAQYLIAVGTLQDMDESKANIKNEL